MTVQLFPVFISMGLSRIQASSAMMMENGNMYYVIISQSCLQQKINRHWNKECKQSKRRVFDLNSIFWAQFNGTGKKFGMRQACVLFRQRAMWDTVGWDASRHQKAGNRPELNLRECA